MTGRKKIDASQEIEKALAVVLEAAKVTQAALVVAEKAIRFARGTEDVTVAAKKVVKAPRKALSNGHDGAGPKKRGRPSPDGGALHRRMEELLRERPMTFKEILLATGETNPNRIKGAITTFQREGLHVVNLGTKGRARWFISGGLAQSSPRPAR